MTPTEREELLARMMRVKHSNERLTLLFSQSLPPTHPNPHNPRLPQSRLARLFRRSAVAADRASIHCRELWHRVRNRLLYRLLLPRLVQMSLRRWKRWWMG